MKTEIRPPKEQLFDVMKNATIDLAHAESLMRSYAIQALRELQVRLAEKITDDIHLVEVREIDNLIRDI